MPRVTVPRILGVLMLAAAADCGGGASPTQPTAPRVPTVLTITPALGSLLVGEARQLSAFMVYSDGAGAAVPASWRVDSPSAAIDDRGLLSVVAPGFTRVTAAAEGRSASLTVRVLPDFNGVWTFNLPPIGCQSAHTGGCDSLYRDKVRVTLLLTQAADRVSGRLATSVGSAAVEGTIASDGVLSLQGESGATDGYADVTYVAFRLGAWATTVDRGRLSGRVVLQTSEYPEYRTAPRSPTLIVTLEFRDVPAGMAGLSR